MNFDELLEGTLCRRYKRFLADVELPGGEIITVHCPNTGAMTGCAEPGSRVWLSRSDSKTRKYPHTWEMVETKAGLACIRSVLANQVVRESFEAGQIHDFETYPRISTEVKYGESSRIDLLLGTRWLRNEGEGRWALHSVDADRSNPDRNRLADINGDGRLDAVVAEELARRV